MQLYYSSRLLKNYLHYRCGVKNRLRMLIIKYKLRFHASFCLASAASETFLSGLPGNKHALVT